MVSLPLQVWEYICTFLPEPSIYAIINVSKLFHEICTSDEFWKQICMQKGKIAPQ